MVVVVGGLRHPKPQARLNNPMTKKNRSAKIMIWRKGTKGRALHCSSGEDKNLKNFS
jgi:hypothetical protein